MIILIVFAFIAGLVTILSPCILPILPIVLSGAISGGKKRPLGAVSYTHLDVYKRQATNNANEQLITMAQQKLGDEKQEIKTDLDNKRREFEKLVESVQKELRDNDKTSQSIIQQIKDHEKITKDLSITTEGLRKVLTNNQLRCLLYTSRCV